MCRAGVGKDGPERGGPKIAEWGPERGPVGVVPSRARGRGVRGGLEGEADWDMVRAGGREGGGIQRLEEREHVWVGERKVDDARSMACCHGEARVDSRGVEELEAQVG